MDIGENEGPDGGARTGGGAVRRLGRLAGGDARLLLEAVAVVGLVRVALWLLPDAFVRRRVESARAGSGGATPDRVAWAVSWASRFVPRSAAPLPKALATLRLLRRHGRPGVLRATGEAPLVEPRPACWVESDGVAVIARRDRRLARRQAHEASSLPGGAEGGLALAIARHGLPGAASAQLDALIGRADARRTARVVRVHRLLPLAMAMLRGRPEHPDAAALAAALAPDQREHEQRSALRVAELARLLAVFERAALQVLPFKGPVLGIAAYGSPVARRFGDLDLLVAPGDYERARTLLAGEGYRLTKRLPWEVALRDDEREVVVDLHRAVAGELFALPLDFEALWERAGRLALGGRDARVLCAHDRLFVLAIQLTNDWVDGRCELGKIRDVAQLVAFDRDIAWEILLEEAHARGGERLVLTAVELAHRVLAVDRPEPVSDRLRALDRAGELAARMEAGLLDRRMAPGYRERVALYAAQRERPAERRALRVASVRRRLVAGAREAWQGQQLLC